MHCSMDKFCNPSHKITENSLATTESMDSSILVPNTERTQTEHCRQNNASEFVVAESQKSEIYALSAGSEKQESEPQPNPAPKQSKTKLHSKQNNAIYLDSSDEDVEVVEEQTKKPKALIENGSKRKIDRVVDSSDDVQPEPHQLRKRTKTSTENSSAKATQESVAKPDALAIEEDLVDDCQFVKKKANDLPQKQPATNASRRSTRSHPQVEQIVVQTKAPASPRRSPRGKQTAGKATLSIAQSDDDSDQDEGLFRFKTQASASVERAPSRPTEVNIESNSVLAEKSVPSPKVNKPARISVRNFLEKSQNHVASQNAESTASQPRKRVRLQLINESDSDDNENLFQFGGAKKIKRTMGSSRSDNDSNDEDLFNFKERAQQEHSKGESDDDDQDSVCTEPFVPETKIKSKYIVPKPKERPRKVDISAWLSCSGLHEDVKPEPKPDPDVLQMDADTVKEETEDDKEKLEHLKWLASIKNSIQVRMCNMSICVRGPDETDAANTTENKYGDRKNFKKFAKVHSICSIRITAGLLINWLSLQKGNVHSQRHIVGLKRMQLAEGMVSDL